MHRLSLHLTDPHQLLVDGDAWFDLAPAVDPTVGGEVEARAIALDDRAVLLALAGRDLHGLAGSGFTDPRVAWSLRPRVDDLTALGVRSFGYQYMEFALPSSAGPDAHGLAPWPVRPAAAMPVLWGAPGGPCVLLGPLDHPHEQVVVVSSDELPRDDVRCGWHGDLDEVAGLLETELVVLVAGDARDALARYGELVQDRAGTQRAHGLAADPAVRALSYWTDNGAEYYYRAAPGRTYPETIGDAVDALAAAGLPMHAVQLDSWWYPHATLRELGEGAPVVPPTGAVTWSPRDDALPGGFAAVAQATGGLPLVLHSRHLAEASPYFSELGFAALVDDGGSGHVHPAGDDLLDAWMEQASQWGACTYEQDWLVEVFLTVSGLRRRPGLADAWLSGMDASAARRGLTLQLCMATPANFLHTAAMTQVSSIRTSMDFRYLADRQGNWGWFLHVNALARAMGLATSKDVFVSTGDEFAAVETCLAALSCGPVGIGDPIGATDRDLVLRTCRPDGVLVAPDVPLTALAPSFFAEPMGSAAPLVAECWTDHPAGRWHYVVACAAAPEARTEVAVSLADLDGAPAVAHLARHDRSGAIRVVEPDDAFAVLPGDDALDLWVVAPLLLGGSAAVFGDCSKFASAGDRRIGRITERDGEVSFLVYGEPGSTVVVAGWGLAPDGAEVDDLTRGWEAPVEVGAHGWARVSIRKL